MAQKKKQQQQNLISTSDSIELMMDYGVNLYTRTLEITGEVDEKMFVRISRGLSMLNKMEPKRITLQLNTFGGCLYSAFGIYDLIKHNHKPVDILAVGACMSAGTVIMQAANERLARPMTQLMVHLGTEAIFDDVKNVRRYVAHADEMKLTMEDIFCQRCNWTVEQFEKFFDRDTYLTAKDALQIGLIDRVWHL